MTLFLSGKSVSWGHAFIVFGVIGAVLSACAPTHSKSGKAVQQAPAPTDTITFVYLPRYISDYPDYQSFREANNVLSEFMNLDLALRECDYATDEIGGADFAQLQHLTAKDSAIGPEDFQELHFASRRLLLIMDMPSKVGPTAGTKAKDAVNNTITVAGKAAALLTGNALLAGNTLGLAGGGLQSTREYGHAFRAIYFDKVENRILIDTTSAITTEGQRAPGQKSSGSFKKHHYKQFIESRLITSGH